MLRIRFHGRGGQGMKTASRIAGTAALWEGHRAQDSPGHGVEQRGALRGLPSVIAPAHIPRCNTGNRRVWRPVIDLSGCTRCWICFVS